MIDRKDSLLRLPDVRARPSNARDEHRLSRLEKLPDWPEGMPWEWALIYTGVGEAQMRDWQKRGLVVYRARGPKGSLVTSKRQLDEALRQLFAGGADVSEDLDFGD